MTHTHTDTLTHYIDCGIGSDSVASIGGHTGVHSPVTRHGVAQGQLNTSGLWRHSLTVGSCCFDADIDHSITGVG